MSFDGDRRTRRSLVLRQPVRETLQAAVTIPNQLALALGEPGEPAC
jgi:hypothetical protein